MRLGRTLVLLEKLIIFAIAFAVVVFVLTALRFWQSDLSIIFLRSGRWYELIALSLIATFVAFVLIKLLQWQFRIETRH